MVMGRLASDIGVLPGREIQPLDGADVLQDLKRSEDRGSADTKPASSCRLDEAGGGEVAILIRDEHGNRPARLCQTVAGAIESGHDGSGVAHAGTVAQLRHSLN